MEMGSGMNLKREQGCDSTANPGSNQNKPNGN